VPGGGVEPPRAEARRILSPLRLPVPPSRLNQAKSLAGNDLVDAWCCYFRMHWGTGVSFGVT
jgi:hypothetical protein